MGHIFTNRHSHRHTHTQCMCGVCASHDPWVQTLHTVHTEHGTEFWTFGLSKYHSVLICFFPFSSSQSDFSHFFFLLTPNLWNAHCSGHMPVARATHSTSTCRELSTPRIERVNWKELDEKKNGKKTTKHSFVISARLCKRNAHTCTTLKNLFFISAHVLTNATSNHTHTDEKKTLPKLLLGEWREKN